MSLMLSQALLCGEGLNSRKPFTADAIKSFALPKEAATVVNRILSFNWKERTSAEKAAQIIFQ